VVDPTWLDEAYVDAIAHTDVGLAHRCVEMSACVSLIARSMRLRGPFLDFGAGDGLMVRMLRDRGLDFRWYDPMAENRYAVGHESEPAGRFGMVTAMEVVEHLLDPVVTIGQLAMLTDVIVVSTFLVDEPPPSPGDWWYYGPEAGQHVTFLSRRGLAGAAASLGMHLTSHRNMHVLSRRRIPLAVRRLWTRPGIAVRWASLRPWPSLTGLDHASAIGRLSA